MNIVVDAAFLNLEASGDYASFLEEAWRLLVSQHTDTRFYFITDAPYSSPVALPANVRLVTLLPKRKNSLVQKYWYAVKLPPVLKRLAADVFVAAAGTAAGTTQWPQLLMVPPAYTENGKPGSKERKSLAQKRSIAGSLQKAATLTVISATAGQQLAAAYSIPAGKIMTLLQPVRPRFTPCSFEEQEVVKTEFTGGAGYFICTEPDLSDKATIEVLRGFSIFKKRLQSSLKLVLAGTAGEVNAFFTEQLSTYRYREDVVLLTSLSYSTIAALLASAYGALFPYPFKAFHTLLPEALQCGTPVLIAEEAGLKEVAGEAGLDFSGHYKDIGEKMMLLYKDEALRGRMIQAGKGLAATWTLSAAANAIWESLQHAKSGVPNAERSKTC